MNERVAEFDSKPRVILTEQARPTRESVGRINSHFRIILPELLVALGQGAKNYSAIFASIGTDYGSAAHIIRLNSYWRRRRRTRRIPAYLVIITQGFMDDQFWCLNISRMGPGLDPYPVQFWCPVRLDYPSEERPALWYPSFEAFLDGLINGR